MSEQVGYPKVQGKCPMGCGETLFLGQNGYVTGSLIGCPDPCAPSDILGVQFPPSRHAHLTTLVQEALGVSADVNVTT